MRLRKILAILFVTTAFAMGLVGAVGPSGLSVGISSASAKGKKATIKAIDDKSFLISSDTGRCLSAPSFTRHWQGIGRIAVVEDCNPLSGDQLWTYRNTFDFGLRVGHLADPCLDIKGADGNAGAIVEQWRCVGDDNQKWGVMTNGTIVSMMNGMCVTVAGASKRNRASVIMFPCQGKKHQKWTAITPHKLCIQRLGPMVRDKTRADNVPPADQLAGYCLAKKNSEALALGKWMAEHPRWSPEHCVRELSKLIASRTKQKKILAPANLNKTAYCKSNRYEATQAIYDVTQNYPRYNKKNCRTYLKATVDDLAKRKKLWIHEGVQVWQLINDGCDKAGQVWEKAIVPIKDMYAMPSNATSCRAKKKEPLNGRTCATLQPWAAGTALKDGTKVAIRLRYLAKSTSTNIVWPRWLGLESKGLSNLKSGDSDFL